jgi:hypothetical protein
MTDIDGMTMRWHGRSRLNKMLIVGLVALSASLLPAAGSFVPGSGNLVFGGVANAACKWDGKPGPGSLTNKWSVSWGWAQVKTGWCYDGVHVTSRHSVPTGGVSWWAPLSGTAFAPLVGWAWSSCQTFNGITNHNCLTRAQFKFYSSCFDGGRCPKEEICIHTRIYGDGHHSRQITEGRCPAPNNLPW